MVLLNTGDQWRAGRQPAERRPASQVEKMEVPLGAASSPSQTDLYPSQQFVPPKVWSENFLSPSSLHTLCAKCPFLDFSSMPMRSLPFLLLPRESMGVIQLLVSLATYQTPDRAKGQWLSAAGCTKAAFPTMSQHCFIVLNRSKVQLTATILLS